MLTKVINFQTFIVKKIVCYRRKLWHYQEIILIFIFFSNFFIKTDPTADSVLFYQLTI